jgi:hypothetical protein
MIALMAATTGDRAMTTACRLDHGDSRGVFFVGGIVVGFRSVKATSLNNIRVWSRKVECPSDNVKVPDGGELFKRVSR